MPRGLWRKRTCCGLVLGRSRDRQRVPGRRQQHCSIADPKAILKPGGGRPATYEGHVFVARELDRTPVKGRSIAAPTDRTGGCRMSRLTCPDVEPARRSRQVCPLTARYRPITAAPN
jgi:hypothetical protein